MLSKRVFRLCSNGFRWMNQRRYVGLHLPGSLSNPMKSLDGRYARIADAELLSGTLPDQSYPQVGLLACLDDNRHGRTPRPGTTWLQPYKAATAADNDKNRLRTECGVPALCRCCEKLEARRSVPLNVRMSAAETASSGMLSGDSGDGGDIWDLVERDRCQLVVGGCS